MSWVEHFRPDLVLFTLCETIIGLAGRGPDPPGQRAHLENERLENSEGDPQRSSNPSISFSEIPANVSDRGRRSPCGLASDKFKNFSKS